MASERTNLEITPDIINDVCTRILNGETTTAVSRAYNRSDAWSWNIATENGLRYNRQSKAWRRMETAAMEQGSISTAEYTELVTPERERTNSNGTEQTPQAAAAAAVVNDMPSLDDDIQEALDLLSQAEQQRKVDIATIDQLHRQLADAERITANISDKCDQLRAAKHHLETRVLQLETENKRLMDKLKGEISRGLLRQGMDSLRKVL